MILAIIMIRIAARGGNKGMAMMNSMVADGRLGAVGLLAVMLCTTGCNSDGDPIPPEPVEPHSARGARQAAVLRHQSFRARRIELRRLPQSRHGVLRQQRLHRRRAKRQPCGHPRPGATRRVPCTRDLRRCSRCRGRRRDHADGRPVPRRARRHAGRPGAGVRLSPNSR